MLNLTGLTAHSLGALLESAGVYWSHDQDGDVLIRASLFPDETLSYDLAEAESQQTFKLVEIYLIPSEQGLLVQVFAKVQFNDRPVFMRPIPPDEHVRIIENAGFKVVEENNLFRLASGVTFVNSIEGLIRDLFLWGLAMFSERGVLAHGQEVPKGINFFRISEEQAAAAMYAQLTRFADR